MKRWTEGRMSCRNAAARAGMQLCFGIMWLAGFGYGCAQELPGEPVASLTVRGSLVENQCGPNAVPAFDDFSFEVELRRDESGEAYWVRGGSPIVTGTEDSPLEYSFQTDLAVSTTVPGCTLRQLERIELQLDEDEKDEGGAEPAETNQAFVLTGSNTVEISAAMGSNCGALLRSLGGPFETLPCRLEYDLEGATN